MLTVACVLKSGGVYTPEYVERLRHGVGQHLDHYKFVCLSDMEIPDRIALEHDWPGWWAKIELFKLEGPVLYFDLDTIIKGDLSEIADQCHKHEFITLNDFYREKGIGSGMMGWSGSVKYLYDAFVKDPKHYMEKYRNGGDQLFLESQYNPVKWQNIVRGHVASYKVHVMNGKSEGARVICFHGKPKPQEVNWLE